MAAFPTSSPSFWRSEFDFDDHDFDESSQRLMRPTWTEASRNAYAALNKELYSNEGHEFRNSSMTESVHTEFQEQRDEVVQAVTDLDSYRMADPPGSRTPTQLIYEGVDEYDPPPPPRISYMGQKSPFSLDNSEPCSDDRPENWYPEGRATLSFPGVEGGEIMSIHNVNLPLIEEHSLLLAAAFEFSKSGPQLFLEPLSSDTAVPFLRFLYSGNYSLLSQWRTDVPTSVLLHCQLFRLGTIYDLDELMSQAYVNVLRQCEYGCSSPEKPIHLCEAIRYCYKHLPEHERLIDAIVNYCVSCFLSHRLADDPTFKELAFELRPFHQALCQSVRDRDFKDESAMAIIQMPFESHVPPTYASRTDQDFSRVGDVVFHFHSNEDTGSSPGKRKRGEPTPQQAETEGSMPRWRTQAPEAGRLHRDLFTIRTRSKVEEPLTDTSTSEIEDEKVVRRRTSSVSSPLSDDDFDIVQRPGQVEALSSGDDSDTDTIVEVEQTVPSASNGGLALPVRPHGLAAAAELQPFDSSSDSEWDVV